MIIEIEDARFLVTLAAYTMGTKPPKGLDPTFYLTNRYEDDLAIWARLEKMREAINEQPDSSTEEG